MTRARLRQWLADLQAAFWLRPAAMTLGAIVLAEALIRLEGAVELPDGVRDWVYRGGTSGARDVLGAIAAATIGVAGTTFSITVAALSLASNQMGPRLLRNFTSDVGNQYALGTLVATFAYALVALRAVHQEAEEEFVPQLAVSVGLLLAFACVAVLIWFLHHIASSINVDRVIALVHGDLATAMEALPRRSEAAAVEEKSEEPRAETAPLCATATGYLRVLDDATLADWAEQRQAVLRLRVRPGDFVFPGAVIGEVAPAAAREEAQEALARGMSIGDSRSVEQDLEFAVRQLVEVGLRALSPSLHDPFTAVAVLDRLGAALCELAGRVLPDGRTRRAGRLRLRRPTTDYAGLLDAMFHLLRQAAVSEPAVLIRLLEVLAEVAAVERDPSRRRILHRHAELAREAAAPSGADDPSVREAVAERYARVLAALGERKRSPV
jgi:uncharacterized membrane protein